MEFCDDCGSMMKKMEGKWLCNSCNNEEIIQKKKAEVQRDAVVLTCPICNKRRPYCGASTAPLGVPRIKMGIIRHLDHHDLTDDKQAEVVVQTLQQHEIRSVRPSICNESSDRGWDYYDF